MRVPNALAALAVLAGVGAAPAHASPPADFVPLAAASYPSSDMAARPEIAAPRNPRPFAFDPALTGDVGAPQQQSYLPVLYSLLVPGAGEISMGYYGRGIALVAVEIAAWSGYYVKHNDGLDQRAAYEAFADEHWDMDKWIQEHPCNVEQYGDGQRTLENLELCGQASSGSGAWPGYIPYVAKSDDKQHYYENLGKYDWYISGWSDWDPVDPYPMDTALRDQYRAMRKESNDSLDNASAFVWVSVVARAFSLAETAIIVHNRRAGEPAGDGSGMALRARPRGFDGGELALEVNFR
ncbi:MAG TPA: hypothetical protein VFX92_05890 [Candidatus Krumholzibacteria bacterium]|nr:hypothetical protein [Candidatus Krumholzibacteria bacterium]